MKKVTAKVLVLGAVLLSTGASFMWPINTIFIHTYLHKSLTVAGIVLFFNSLFSFFGNYVGGKMFDRLGGHKTAIINALIAIFALVGLIFNHSWPAFPILLPILGFGVGGSYTVVNSFVAHIEEADRYKVFNNIYVGSKIGSMIGTALCGFVVSVQISLVFVANCICLSIFLIVAIFLYGNRQEFIKKVEQKARLFTLKLYPGIGLIALFLGMTWIVNSQWGSNISAHLTDIGIPIGKYSFLWTMNSLIVIVLMPLINHFAENRDWFKRIQIPVGVLFFITALISLINAKEYAAYAIGMVILTLGEMLVNPAIPALVSETTPRNESGRYQSLVSMTGNFAKAIGPFLGGVLIENSSYNVLFLSAIMLLILSLGIFRVARKRLVAERI